MTGVEVLSKKKLDNQMTEIRGAVFSQLWTIQDYFIVILDGHGKLHKVAVGDARLFFVLIDNIPTLLHFPIDMDKGLR